MRTFLLVLIATAVVAAGVTPPAKLVFPSKTGRVAYDHAAHVKRAKGECGACHSKPWPQSTKVALNSKDCKMCHEAGRAAFQMKGNCARCHEGAKNS